MAEEDKKRSPEEQIDEGKENNKEDESAAGGILKGIGKMILGLGGLIKGLEKSPAFKERLKEVDKELEHKLKSTPLKRSGERSTHMSGRWKLRPLRRGSSGGTRPVEKREPSPPPPQERPADIFDEQDHIKVIAEIPGAEVKDIKVNLQDDILIISVDIPNRKYHQELKLPCSPKGKLEKSYKNGILEIKIIKQ